MRTFAVGDIHGAYLALKQVLELANFDRENDRLISLGDVTDTWPDSVDSVDALLDIRFLVGVKGNHDIWAQTYLENGRYPHAWTEQGGLATIHSYIKAGRVCDVEHARFFKNQVLYFIDEDRRLYVHGGFDLVMPIAEQRPERLCWDRQLWKLAMASAEGEGPFPHHSYESVFIGHTPTIAYYNHEEPVRIGNIWNLDQGVKGGGPLTLMDVETKEYWQSDPVRRLYSQI